MFLDHTQQTLFYLDISFLLHTLYRHVGQLMSKIHLDKPFLMQLLPGNNFQQYM
jgi:hypothetical protein